MDRYELGSWLLKIVTEGDEIILTELSRCQKYRRAPYTKGIYLVYDEHKQIIYVGKINGGETSSLYGRFYGQGSSSHSRQEWFRFVRCVKFKQLDHVGEQQLFLIERLIIWASGQPIYNDGGTDSVTLDRYDWDKFTLSTVEDVHDWVACQQEG